VNREDKQVRKFRSVRSRGIGSGILQVPHGEQRLDILLELIARHRANKRLEREFIESLISNGVEYVIVGGFAQAFRGRPRFTGDIDIAIRPSHDNAVRVRSAISQFGFEALGLGADDFLVEGQVIQLGVAPNRIDLLTSLTGCDFEDVWATRIPAQIGGVLVNMIGKEQFIRNKRAVGRSQDLADLETLG